MQGQEHELKFNTHYKSSKTFWLKTSLIKSQHVARIPKSYAKLKMKKFTFKSWPYLIGFIAL